MCHLVAGRVVADGDHNIKELNSNQPYNRINHKARKVSGSINRGSAYSLSCMEEQCASDRSSQSSQQARKPVGFYVSTGLAPIDSSVGGFCFCASTLALQRLRSFQGTDHRSTGSTGDRIARADSCTRQPWYKYVETTTDTRGFDSAPGETPACPV